MALTARNVLARPVTARLVVVALVVVERPAIRLEKVELAVEMMPLLKVCRALHILVLPRLRPTVLAVPPLYDPEKVKVLSVAVRAAKLLPRDMPLMVELARYELDMEVVADTAPLVPRSRPESDPSDRPLVVVVPFTVNPPANVEVAVEVD